MPRKKDSEDGSDIAAAVNLRDDEEIIIADTRTIGKQKRGAKKAAEPEVEIIDDADLEAVESYEFPEGTIGAILNRSEDEQYRDQQATIMVVRKPDSAGEKFLNPCTARLNMQPIRNVDLSRPIDEIEDLLRMTYGGGHYYCQIRIGNQIQTGFEVDIADPPQAQSKPELASLSLGTKETPAAPVNPLDSFFDQIDKMQRLKTALFGDREKELERQIEELKQEIRDARNGQISQPQSESLLILEKALSTNNPTIQDKLLEAAFPSDSGGHWLSDVIKLVIENPEKVSGVLQAIVGGVAPQQLPAGGVHALLQKPAPVGGVAPQTRQSNFRRSPAGPPKPESAENGKDTDASAGDKQQTPEAAKTK
jgi:hypothetical protein